MGLFTNYKKLNETNKQQIIKTIDRVINLPNANAFLNTLNGMKNSLLNQAPSDSKALKAIDEQVIASLAKAMEMLNAGNASQANTYIVNAQSKIFERVSALDVKGFKTGKEPKLNEEQLAEILLSAAQDKITKAAMEYNDLLAKANAGDMVAKSKLTVVYQKYQIANQNFTAISNNQNRDIIAQMVKGFTDEQKQRISERKISEEEFSFYMQQYQEIAATVAREGADVLTGTTMISTVSGALNQNQQDITEAMNIGIQMGGVATNGLPGQLAVPGMAYTGASAATPSFAVNQTAPASFNPFAPQQQSDLDKYSLNQLRGSINLLDRQIEDKTDKQAELRAERTGLDRKMEKLLTDYKTLPPAKAKILEGQIRSLKALIDSSNFQMNNVDQELLQLNYNKSMIEKTLSLKDREMSEKAVNQTMGGKLDLKEMATDIAKQVEKNNEKIVLGENVNVVSNADNIAFGTGAIDLSSLGSVEKSNEFDDLMKMYNIDGEQQGSKQ